MTEKSLFKRCGCFMVFPKIVGFPPNHPISIGFSIINHPFWGTSIFGNTHVDFHDFPSFLMFNRLTQPNPLWCYPPKTMPLQEKNRPQNDNPSFNGAKKTPSISVSIRRSNSFCKACVSLSRANWAHLHGSTWWHVRFALVTVGYYSHHLRMPWTWNFHPEKVA